MKHTIDYGFGTAILYTPYDPEDRFWTLASTCFGIRKSIEYCIVLKSEEVDIDDFERLEFNGDVYVWDKDGRRKMLKPWLDEEWDDSDYEECRYIDPEGEGEAE